MIDDFPLDLEPVILENEPLDQILSLMLHRSHKNPDEVLILLILYSHQKMLLEKLRYKMRLPWSEFNDRIEQLTKSQYIYSLAINVDGVYHNIIMISPKGRNFVTTLVFNAEL